MSAAELFLSPGQDPLQAAEEVPAPMNVNPKLWQTFHRELITRTAHLCEILRRAQAGDINAALNNAAQLDAELNRRLAATNP